MPSRHDKKKSPVAAPDEAFRTIYDRSPVGIAELDDAGRFTRVNAALQRMLGRTEAEITTLAFNQVTHPEDLANCEALFARLVNGEIDDFEIEKRFVRKDGRVIWGRTAVTAVRASGRACSMVCMTIDVTERRLVQEELERRVAERTVQLSYRDAVLTAQQESSPDGILVVDAEGRIVSQNKRFAEMWGIPVEIVASGSDERAIESVLSKLVDPQGFLARVRELYEHRDEKSSDELALRDGRTFERYSSPVRDAEGRYHGRVWYFHDVTDRVRRENDLRVKTEELSVSNTGLAVYAFAASHDLQAPLRKIITFGDLLNERAKGKLDAADLDFLERMRSSAASASQLVADLLTLSQVSHEDHPSEPVDLNAVLREVRQDLEAEIAAAGATLEAGALPILRAHPVLLRSLLMNLVSNAVKFRKTDQPPVVRVDSRRVGEKVELSVSDNGIGFDQAYAEKVFQPFMRLNASSVFQGSGIGLTICRRVVQRYGGTLTVVSEPGRGATFTVRLPAEMLALG